MSKLLPYETIVKAHEGDPDAIDTVLSHYAGYIRYFSKVHGQVNAEVEEYVKQQLIAALFKFRFDRFISVFLQRSTGRLQKCRFPVLLSVCSGQGNRSRERNAVPLWSSSATQPKSLTRTDSAEPEPALSCFHK